MSDFYATYEPPDWSNQYSLYLDAETDRDKKFSPDKCAMFREVNINLRIYADGQHDERLLTEEEVALNEQYLASEIIAKIAGKVHKFVKETDAFNIHR